MKETNENIETKKTREYDNFQKAAINAMKNSVVSAGAGSGKTSVLSERFCNLIFEKNINVDEILTLTFTKKATVEMSDRIYKALKEKLPEQAAIFYKNNIRTLDSYFNSIAKTGAHFYGISPDFMQDSDSIYSKAYSMALPFILEHRDNEAIKLLVKDAKFDSIATELFADPILENSTVVNPIDFNETTKIQIEEVCQQWQKLTKKIKDSFNSLCSIFDENQVTNKSSSTYEQIVENYSDENRKNFPDEVEINYQKVFNCDIEDCVQYFKIISEKNFKKPGNLKGLQGLSEEIDNFKELVGKMNPLFNYIYGFKWTKMLLPLMEEFQNKVNDFKRQSGILTFNDISSLALKTMIEHPEIRQIEKEKFKAIMIDEFQDNNSDQRDLLFLIAENLERKEKSIPQVSELCPDKLFFVGDEKQSIYRFRGADVSVFRALSKDFKEGNLSMSTNYRSTHSLIAGFNTIFGGMNYPGYKYENPDEEKPSIFYTESQEEKLLKNNEKVPEYEAIYHEVTLPKDKKEEVEKYKDNLEKLYAPHIHIATYDSKQDPQDYELTEENAEAMWVTKKIKSLITPDENGNVKYNPSDICVLFKNYKLQHIYERYFLNSGIPYDTEVSTGIFSDGPVNDIFAMLKLISFNYDTKAFAQILRSPWMNFDINSTSKILIQNETENCLPFQKEQFDFLSEENKIQYSRIREYFIQLKEEAKISSITSLVTKLWYESGYRYETMWNQTVEMYSRQYDMIFELARQADVNGIKLTEFIDDVKTYNDDSIKLSDMEIPLEQKNGVHIMSIHKSKGLEFPVVFVCATHKGRMNEHNSKIVYANKKYGISINTPKHPLIKSSKKYSNYFYEKLQSLNQMKTEAEDKRVCYVALTRAKNELYITNGKYNFSNKKFGTMSEYLEPILSYYGMTPDTFDENSKIKCGPFDYENIPPANREFSQDTQTRQNTKDDKEKFIKLLEENQYYENAASVSQEELKRIYANPSQLHEADDETYSQTEIKTIIQSEKNAFPEYDKINQIIEGTIPAYSTKENNPVFDHGKFGTLAHKYCEANINGTEIIVTSKDIPGLEDKKKDLEMIKAICKKMADSFIETELGQKAKNSSWHKAEYEFRSRIFYGTNESKIIKGIMDLIFKDSNGNYVIVDYKTNQEIKPEIYANQLTCYRQAISSILNIEAEKIKCFLHYLRFNKSVEITDLCNETDLIAAIKQIEE